MNLIAELTVGDFIVALMTMIGAMLVLYGLVVQTQGQVKHMKGYGEVSPYHQWATRVYNYSGKTEFDEPAGYQINVILNGLLYSLIIVRVNPGWLTQGNIAAFLCTVARKGTPEDYADAADEVITIVGDTVRDEEIEAARRKRDDFVNKVISDHDDEVDDEVDIDLFGHAVMPTFGDIGNRKPQAIVNEKLAAHVPGEATSDD